MPLVTTGGPAKYHGSEVVFAMRDADVRKDRRVIVVVSRELMDKAAPSARSGEQMVAWVATHRAKLERIASEKHDEGLPPLLMPNDWFVRYPFPV